MITTITVHCLACDRCKAPFPLLGRSAQGVRDTAKYDHAWAYRKHRDLCPACFRAVAHEETDAELDRKAAAADATAQLAGQSDALRALINPAWGTR